MQRGSAKVVAKPEIMSRETWSSRLFEIARQSSHTVGQNQELKDLLNKGAKIDTVNEDGQTCLHIAVINGNTIFVDTLLEYIQTGDTFARHTVINQKDNSGTTPLAYAIRTKHFASIKSLVKAGASSYGMGHQEILQLITIALEKNSSADLADLLLKEGVDVNLLHTYNDTPLMYFARRGNIQAVQKLLTLNADVNGMKRNGMTALAAAAEQESHDIIKLLIEKGATVNPPNGKLPLVRAVENDNFEIAKSLVAHGASVNKVDSQGNSPLSTAVRTNNYEIIEWLLDNGARFSIHSVFLQAVERGNFQVIEMLIEKGAKVNMQYNSGLTPLLTAINARHVDVIEILLAHGADINLEGKDYNGTPILPFRRLLETGLPGVKFNRIVKTFIDNGADVNIICSNGVSWLAKYAQLDDYQMVQYLVSKGANINQTSDPKHAPLVIAAKNLNFQMFDYLVNSGGDIEQVREEVDKVANQNDSFAIFLEELCDEQKKKKNQVTDKGHEGEVAP